jgi:uncharacterized membrane protein
MKTKEMAFGAIIIAIIMMMAIVPQLGFVLVGPVSMTLIHIPVLIMAFTFRDNRNMALIAGAAFGFGSWLAALTRASTPMDVLFQNPIVSVLPRILFALIAYELYRFLTKYINDNFAQIISILVSLIAHAIMVYSLMYIFGRSLFDEGLLVLILGIMGVSSIVEKVLAIIIVPIVVNALRKALRI